ncbi:MBL fold metallo-hydrolase [Cellulomonas sp. P22]|uniref:MBL fold metallo-hydrolase n=1 Tax=Cellulomonas sp. P22 TaxID=3373189 RepID=UPI0037AADB90
MQLITVVAPVFGANCYVLAADDRTCVVIDPGGGAAPGVRRAVDENGLVPVAVLATHGHVDHTWDAAELVEEYDVPLLLHRADAYRLADPFGTLGLGSAHDAGGPLAQSLTAIGAGPSDYRVPSRIEPFGAEDGPDGGPTPDVTLELGGLRLVARHAPGHTEGSTLYLLDAVPAPVAFTGDVLFAGTIGRTDLPGGDQRVMDRTLRDVVRVLDGDTVALPGHGPGTTMDDELGRNPFLAG